MLTKKKESLLQNQIEPQPPIEQPKSNIKDRKSVTKSKKSKKDDKQQTQFTSILKLFNIILGLIVIGFGVYCYFGFKQQAQRAVHLVGYILPGYIALSGLIIVSIQCHISFIWKNMRFLYNYFGRGLFNIYAGIMPITLITQGEQGNQQDIIFQIVVYIMVSLLCLVGILYILLKIFCCAKQGEKRKKAIRKSKRNNSDSDISSDQD